MGKKGNSANQARKRQRKLKGKRIDIKKKPSVAKKKMLRLKRLRAVKG